MTNVTAPVVEATRIFHVDGAVKSGGVELTADTITLAVKNR